MFGKNGMGSFGGSFGGLFFEKDEAASNTADGAGAIGEGETHPNAEAGDDKNKSKPTQKVTFSDEQQAAVDLIVRDRLKQAQRRAEQDAEKMRKQAEEDALTKNQEFKTLAEQRQVTIAELESRIQEFEPLKDETAKYKGAMQKIVQAQVSKLPMALRVLVEKMDPLDQMNYLAEHAKELNLAVEGVPETETSDSTHKLNKEAQDKAQRSNAKLVKGFFGG